MTTQTQQTPPRRIVNPHQRDAATFLETSAETGGERSVGELEIGPGGRVTPHSHLDYSEHFRVLAGRMTLELDGARRELGPGDEALVAPGRLHAWSNPTSERALARIELRPGQPGFELALRVAYGLAADGRVLADGMPRNVLHTALLLAWGKGRLPGTAYRLLEPLLALLTRLARVTGVERDLVARYAAEPW